MIRAQLRLVQSKPLARPGLEAAIYCRVSAEDTRAEKNKSVEHQREQALAYAEKKGWTVKPEFIFVDDGISGGEYVNRPGLARLLATMPKHGKPPFDVLVMSESSRLGRDMLRNASLVVDLIESGVKIFYYLTDEEELADTPEQRFMAVARSFASEVERVKAGERTRAKLTPKAQQGFSTGGSCFGYDTFEVMGPDSNGEQVRSHVDWRINEAEAEVVRRIFKMSLAGYGLTRIAKTLNGVLKYQPELRKFCNGRRPPSPRGGTGSWAGSSIRAMLYNPRYIGKIPYGAVRRVWKKGTKKRVRDGQVTYAARPDLRIVPQDLWEAVQKRLKAARQTYIRDNGGTLWGRPETGGHSKYLLSEIARCGICGASMVHTKGLGNGRSLYRRYACSRATRRGDTVCSNTYREAADKLEGKVIAAIQRSILTPERVEAVIDRALEMARQTRKQEPDNTKKLEAEIRRVKRERDRLVAACARGRLKAPESLTVEIERRERQMGRMEAELAQSPHRLSYEARDLEALQALMTERMNKFRELMEGRHVPAARQALRKLLNGHIKCIPMVLKDGKKDYRIEGETKLGALLSTASEPLVPRKRHRGNGFLGAEGGGLSRRLPSFRLALPNDSNVFAALNLIEGL